MSAGEAEGGNLWTPDKSSIARLSGAGRKQYSLRTRKIFSILVMAGLVAIILFYLGRSLYFGLTSASTSDEYWSEITAGATNITWSSQDSLGLFLVVIPLVGLVSFLGFTSVRRWLTGVPKWENLWKLTALLQLIMLISITVGIFFSMMTPVEALRDNGVHAAILYDEDGVIHYAASIEGSDEIYPFSVTYSTFGENSLNLSPEFSEALRNQSPQSE